MELNLKRETYDNRLPAAACTSEMLKDVKALAKQENTSESAIIRAGVAFILREMSRKSNKKIEKQDDETQS